MPKKIFALVPSEREKECDHRQAAYSGRIPCTGPIICAMCGARLPADFFGRQEKEGS